MCSSLLPRQCPEQLVRLTWMVLEMVGRWSFSRCFVGPCFQYLFNIARSVLEQFSFFSLYALSASILCIYIVVWTRMMRGKIAFHFIG